MESSDSRRVRRAKARVFDSDHVEKRPLVILGAGGHGKVVADIARTCGYTCISFLDDVTTDTRCLGYPIIGRTTDAEKYLGCEFVVAIGDGVARRRHLNRLVAWGATIATLVHADAVVAPDVTIGTGTVVMAGAIINPGSRVGSGCIINTSSSIDHDNVVDDYAHISVGARLAGHVHVGTGTWIGIGAVVINDVSICAACTVGAGAVVVDDADMPGIYVGVPARLVRHAHVVVEPED